MLLSGLYHPPKTTYEECDSMDYLVNFFGTMLDKHLNISIVCGGDLNRLDLTRLKRIPGWTASSSGFSNTRGFISGYKDAN